MGFPKKITDLPLAGALKLSDIFVLVNQHSVTSQTTLGNIAALLSGSVDTNTFVTGGTLTGANLILKKNDNTNASPIDLSPLSGGSGDLQTVLNEGSVASISSVLSAKSDQSIFLRSDDKITLSSFSNVDITSTNFDMSLECNLDMYLNAGQNTTIYASEEAMLSSSNNKVMSEETALLYAQNRWVLVSSGQHETTSEYPNAKIGVSGNTFTSRQGQIEISAYDGSLLPPGVGPAATIFLDGSNQSIRLSGNDLGTPSTGDVLSAKDTDGTLEWISLPSSASTPTLQEVLNEGSTATTNSAFYIGVPAFDMTLFTGGILDMSGDELNTYFDNGISLETGAGNWNLIAGAGDLIIDTNNVNINNIPTVNNSGTQILVRNSATGNVEYRDVSTIGGSFTGNTSGTCISQLWVTSISGCSPLTIGTNLIANEDVRIGASNNSSAFNTANLKVGGGSNGVIAFSDANYGIALGGSSGHISWGGGSLLMGVSSNGFYLTPNQVSQGISNITALETTHRSMHYSLGVASTIDGDGHAFFVKDSSNTDMRVFTINNRPTSGDNVPVSFENITGLMVGNNVSQLHSGVKLHVSGDTLINGALTASTITAGDIDLCKNGGTLYSSSISGCSPVVIGPEVIIEGETTFKGNINLSPDVGTDVDFDNANTVSIPTYVLIDCKDSNNKIVTFQNFSEYVGQVVTLASEGATRWEVTLQPTLEVTSIEECCFDNFKITNCVTGEVWNIVNYEAWSPGPGMIGSIIKIDGEEGCFSVTGTCEEWTLDAKVLVSDQYETCEECTGTTYTIFPCEGWDALPINTDTDLSAYVGGLLAIKEEETGVCYTVLECVEDCEPTISINYEPVLDECENCKDNWQLTNCLGEVVGVTTTQSDLWEPGVAFSSSTIEGCFTVDKIKQAANVGELENIIVVDCLSIECSGEPPITYKLSGCDGLTEFYTDTDLSEYVGSYINSETIPGQAQTCFYVIEEEGESTYEVLEPQAFYSEEEGCDCCGQNPKWKYSACDDEGDQVVWENTTLGPLGIYAPPSCVRMSTDEGETWKCYNFMLCVPEEEPTEGITNFEVLEDSECCEGELCLPAPEGVSFSFQPGEAEGIVEVYYTSNTELSGVNIQFRPGFTVVSATGDGGAAGDAGFSINYTSEIPLEEGSEINTSKVAIFSFDGATIGINEEPTLLLTLSIAEDNSGVLLDNPISTIRYTTTTNNVGWEGTINDYAPDSILNVLDVVFIWQQAMSVYFGVREVSSQYEAQGEPYDDFLVAGPATGGLELLVGTTYCILGEVDPPCSTEEPFVSNYVSWEDIGEGSIEPWPIV